MAQLLETGHGSGPADREETDALITQALESAPDNALAISLVALTRGGGGAEAGGACSTGGAVAAGAG